MMSNPIVVLSDQQHITLLVVQAIEKKEEGPQLNLCDISKKFEVLLEIQFCHFKRPGTECAILEKFTWRVQGWRHTVGEEDVFCKVSLEFQNN